MTRTSLALLAALLLTGSQSAVAQPVTGLSGWSVTLDPGHFQNANVGIYGYSEAHKNLRVGFALQDLLLSTTDIGAVYITRTNDTQEVSLTQRVDYANQVAADFFMSIHSNAAGPTANNVLTLWPQHKDLSEVSPLGGKPMAEFVADRLVEGMRIPLLGPRGECSFYGVDQCRTAGARDHLGNGKGGSRNYVQGYTNMASELSEAGFHTNPTQNQRNMNADWKRLEAQSIYWAILQYHGLARPQLHTLTGIVTDLESGAPINGAVVSVQDTSYVTDTWEFLFNQYSADPDLLRNGFYFLDDLDGGDLTVTAAAEGYLSFEDTVLMADTTFTFLDIGLISTTPPTVVSTVPTNGQDPFRVSDSIVIDFSRPMDVASVEAAFETDPAITGTMTWLQGNRRVVFRPDSLVERTTYTMRIVDTAYGEYLHPFDGDGDGFAGGNFEISFTTGFPDTQPAYITASHPRQNGRDVSLMPVLNLVYNEPLDSLSVQGRVQLLKGGTVPVDGAARYYRYREQGVISFFPAAELDPASSYTLEIAPGVSDLFLNEETNYKRLNFTTGSIIEISDPIDDFEGDATGFWWQPQQSGSSTGYLSTETGMSADTNIANGLFGGTQAMRIDYRWDTLQSSWLIREYLGGGPVYSRSFDQGNALRVYVFGDGSGTQFRFCVDDHWPATSGSYHEVSPWFTIDWIGWQPVTWVMYEDGVGTWIGDGVLDGTLHIDSFQLSFVDGAAERGTLWFDDLQLVQAFSTAADDPDTLPDDFELSQNYPNPFNPQTTIDFTMPTSSHVRLAVYDVLGREVAVLRDGVLAAGRHSTAFDASDLASGMYLYRLETSTSVLTRTMLLLK